jgi:hypothetical protein
VSQVGAFPTAMRTPTYAEDLGRRDMLPSALVDGQNEAVHLAMRWTTDYVMAIIYRAPYVHTFSFCVSPQFHIAD